MIEERRDPIGPVQVRPSGVAVIKDLLGLDRDSSCELVSAGERWCSGFSRLLHASKKNRLKAIHQQCEAGIRSGAIGD